MQAFVTGQRKIKILSVPTGGVSVADALSLAWRELGTESQKVL